MVRNKKASGFTLVELLLAATLGAMVVAAAFSSISVALKGYRLSKDRSDVYEPARAALARMSREISSAFLSPNGGKTRFIGVQQEINGVAMDQLSFVAVINNPQYTQGGESDLVEIHYYIDLDQETPERWLQVRYDPTPDDEPFWGGVSHLLGPHVVAMSLFYFDGSSWLPEWDSTDQLPMAVSITVGVAKNGQIERPEDITRFSTIVYPALYRPGAGGTTLVQ